MIIKLRIEAASLTTSDRAIYSASLVERGIIIIFRKAYVIGAPLILNRYEYTGFKSGAPYNKSLYPTKLKPFLGSPS